MQNYQLYFQRLIKTLKVEYLTIKTNIKCQKKIF